MKFINRKEELSLLKSLKGSFFLVVTGRRRIGKTRLLLTSFKDPAYIFVWPNKSLNWIIEKVCQELNIPKFRDLGDILEYMFDKNKVVILDEFQNLYKIDKSVFGEIQKVVDERKHQGKPYKLIVCGSSQSMLTRILYHSASPLYGRRTHEIRLGHLPINELLSSLKLGIKEFIEVWSVFEGVPYYYELLDFNLSAKENIRQLLIGRNAKLQEEGKAVISMEFGVESKTYSTIVTAIAEGKTKLNEIASLFDNKINFVTKYLDILRNRFKLVKRVVPVLSSSRKSKEGIYEISDNFLKFWFYFIEKKRDLIEQERENELISFFNLEFDKFVSASFEKFIATLIKKGFLFKDFTRVGKQWGKIPGKPKGKNTYEIDVVALNEENKEILFCECKWKDRVNAERVVRELAEKSQHVQWHKNKRKESFAIFAKSFSKKIKSFEGKRVYCFDLKDLEKAVKKPLKQ